MKIQLRDDAFGMSRHDGVEQILMGPRDAMRIIIETADQADHHAQLGGEIVEQPQQPARAGDLADQPVKLVVLFHLPRGVVEVRSLVQHVDLSPQGAMPLSDLCEAAITRSDNTAGNLMLGAIGGPAGLTAYARSLGDAVTRLDRMEPDLNEAAPDDPRDTTSPAAMLANLRRLLIGDALSEMSKARLAGWLLGNRTGGARLRAHLPAGWRVGDKTGSGDRGTTNDAGIVWPASGEPILVAAYLTGTEAPADARNAALAEVGRALATLRPA